MFTDKLFKELDQSAFVALEFNAKKNNNSKKGAHKIP